MVGWRRAFCTSIPRDQSRESIATVFATEKSGSNGGSHNPSPRFGAKFSFFSSNSNPSTPRLNAEPTPSPKLRCRTTATTAVTAAAAAAPAESGASSAKLQCRTTKSPRFFSNPPSPRSPSALSLLKSTLRLSKAQSRCGICLQSVKVGQGMAIFTAECSHAFHFPCIASRIAKNAAALLCPVCGCQWKEVPLLSARSSQNPPPSSADPHKKKIDSSPKKEAVNLKVYDDDEPLTTPTAGARFNPIPESDENDDDDEEFQGFFVPAAPVRAAAATPPVVSNSVDVRLSPETAVVTAGRTSETYAVVMKVKAPLAPESSSLLNPTRRAPIDLVTVLDVGGSVTGAKLQMVKSAMRLVISSLCSTDRLSIVAFSTSSKRLLPLRRMTTAGRRSARRIVDSLVAGHGHCSGDALKKAAKVLEDRRERNPVATIILLSDGPNEPISTPPANRCRSLAPVVTSTRFARLEIPVHAVGFGDGGACGHDQAAEDAFAKCVGGLLSVVVQDVRIQIGLGSGSAPFEIPAIYSCSGRPTVYGSGSIRLGDLYAEEERELLVELKVPASSSGARHVLSVRCSCRDPSSQEVIYGRDEAMLVAGPHAVRSSAAGPSIERLRNLFISTRAVAESRRLLERSDFGGAHRLLASARALLSQQSASASAEEFVRGLEAELAELQRRRQQQLQIHHQQQQQQQARGMAAGYVDEKGEPLTPTSAWRAAERLAKVAIMRKSLNRVSDLHGFENARF